MSPQLTAFANEYGIREMLLAAKTHGMRVVGIDSLTASKKPGTERALTMNLVAHDVIESDRAQGHMGKYILLVGAAHAHTHGKNPAQEINSAVPGLSQLLSIPAVKVTAEGVGLYREDKGKRV